jgi:hypothetical protein
VNETATISRDWMIGILGACGVVACMLVYALFGKQVYAFFMPLRWGVAAVAGMGFWALLGMSKRYIPLALCLGLIGLVHLFAKMGKHEWYYFDWAALVLTLLLAFVLAAKVMSRKQSHG